MSEPGVAVVGCGFWANEMHLPAFQKITGKWLMPTADVADKLLDRILEANRPYLPQFERG